MESFTIDLIDGINSFHKLNIKNKLEIYKRLFQDIEILHSNYGLSHNDIKPENIMMTTEITNPDFTVKFIDYGLMENLRTNFNGGTKTYMHPDFFKNDDNFILRKEYDIYSLALSIFLLETDDVDNFELNKFCYTSDFSEKNCTAFLHQYIIDGMNVDFDEVFDSSDDLIDRSLANPDEYIYLFKDFKECKSLGCIVIHCASAKISEIPSVSDIITQLEFVLKLIRDENFILI